MPTVEKTRGNRVYVRSVDHDFEVGDRAEVSADHAAYLVEERGDFEVVAGDASDEVHEEDGPPDDAEGEAAPAVDPGDLTVADLREALDEGDYSVAELEAIREAEQADDDPRTSALDAIDSAIADVEG